MKPTAPATKMPEEDWQNPRVSGVNKLPPRNSSWPCPDLASGLASSYDYSPWLQSLNSADAWRFHWVPDPASRPAVFFRVDFDASNWGTIPVPACWELKGHAIPV
jgi:beta-galactosidase